MSPEPEYRILIVDDRRELARVLRTSLELLNHGYLITDVPSGEEAMLEMARVKFDLIIADYRLPGMSGVELIKRARKQNSNIKEVVITGAQLRDIQKDLDSINVTDVFQKPLDVEGFTNRVDELLLGQVVEQVRMVRLPSQQDVIVPMQGFDTAAAEREVSTLLMAMGCEAVALVNRTGRIVSKDGTFSEAMCFPEIAVLLANNFTTTTEISVYIGEQPPSAMHYYSNEWHDLFALTVSTDFFLVIVFPGGSQKQMGAILRIGKPAAERLAKVIYGEEQAASIVQQTTPEPEPSRPAEEPRRMSLAEEIRQQKRLEEEAARLIPMEDEVPTNAFAELLEESGETIDLDFDALDADLDSLGDLDSLWDESSLAEQASGTDSISIEEAMELGLISDDIEN
jgi:CheY-like chemotaxis protein